MKLLLAFNALALNLVLSATTISTPNITNSRDQYVYWHYYSSCDGTTLVGLQGFVALEEFEVTGAVSEDGSCASEMTCFFDSESNLCSSLEPNGIATVYDAVLPDGNFYECDTSNPLTNEDVCEVYDSSVCFQSSIYPSCQARFLTQGELNDPNLFANPSEDDQADLSNYYYIIYYDNTECTQVAGLRSFVSSEIYELPLLSESITCEDAMACLYDSESDLCKERGGGTLGVANFTYTTGVYPDDSSLSSCDGTLADLADDCVVTTPDQCTQSGVFAGSPCLFRIVSASFLANNPGYLIGDVGQDTAGTEGSDGDQATSGEVHIIHLGLAGASTLLITCFGLMIH